MAFANRQTIKRILSIDHGLRRPGVCVGLLKFDNSPNGRKQLVVHVEFLDTPNLFPKTPRTADELAARYGFANYDSPEILGPGVLTPSSYSELREETRKKFDALDNERRALVKRKKANEKKTLSDAKPADDTNANNGKRKKKPSKPAVDSLVDDMARLEIIDGMLSSAKQAEKRFDHFMLSHYFPRPLPDGFDDDEDAPIPTSPYEVTMAARVAWSPYASFFQQYIGHIDMIIMEKQEASLGLSNAFDAQSVSALLLSMINPGGERPKIFEMDARKKLKVFPFDMDQILHLSSAKCLKSTNWSVLGNPLSAPKLPLPINLLERKPRILIETKRIDKEKQQAILPAFFYKEEASDDKTTVTAISKKKGKRMMEDVIDLTMDDDVALGVPVKKQAKRNEDLSVRAEKSKEKRNDYFKTRGRPRWFGSGDKRIDKKRIWNKKEAVRRATILCEQHSGINITGMQWQVWFMHRHDASTKRDMADAWLQMIHYLHETC